MDSTEQTTPQNGDTAGVSPQAQETPPQAAEAKSETEILSARVTELEAQLKDKDQKHLYAVAEFENIKRRLHKEREDLLKFGWEPVARDLLQVVDNLERAVEHMPPTTDKNLKAGIEMVLQLFTSTLQKRGLLKIESLEKPFDPSFHEAISQEGSDRPEGTVIREHMRGYTLHGRLIRPAQVVVSKGAGGVTEEKTGPS